MKILLITHIADMDGRGNDVLARLVFNNVTTILIEPSELFDTIKNIIDKKDYQNYEQIFITDLAMNLDTALLIDEYFGNKVHHLDHHITNVQTSNKVFEWSTVIEKDKNGFEPCATSLFYDYLLNNYPNNEIIKHNSVKEVVDAIRTQDTYTFEKENNTLGPALTNVFFNTKDDKKYINSIIDRLKNGDRNHFHLTSEEMDIVNKYNQEIDDYIDECDKRLIHIDFLGYKVGLSISSKYRSVVGNRLSKKYKDELNFILIADCKREKFSARTVNNIDLNVICSKVGGGGHPKAAGFNMNDETLKLIYPYLDKNMIKVKKSEGF